MCGISGLVCSEPIADERLVARMQTALHHRGPDGAGEFCERHVALAMRRLSIIDLEHGGQPLFNEDHSVTLIANGEIYNYVELRQRLEARGHKFATASDCETIVHLYEDHGLDFVHHLRGMFAIALWDRAKQRLILVRDRVGEKPLYVFEREGHLLFASELKALLASQSIPFALDPVSVNLYFHYQYVPEPRTPLRGVSKLPAGHLLVVDVRPWQVRQFPYWNLEAAPAITTDPIQTVRNELERVSELVVRSDVPVGVALSGGIDSSAVAALAARKYPGTLTAFSVGYPGRPPYDERAAAESFASHLDIPFHDVELETKQMAGDFHNLVHARDDPIADISGYGYYAVMRLARKQGVPVVLQGQGGDELFWGYPWVRQALEETHRKQRATSRHLLSLLKLRKPAGKNRQALVAWARDLAGLRASIRRIRRGRENSVNQMVFYDLVPDYEDAVLNTAGIYSEEFASAAQAVRPSDGFTFPRPWPRADIRLTRLVTETYLLSNGIAQGDRLSMASSVELRLPLVDYRLAETVIGLRKAQPDHLLSPKAWLRGAVRDLLPAEVLNRQKQGFRPPVREWHQAIFDQHGHLLNDGYLVQEKVLTRMSARRLSRGEFPPGVVSPLSFKALVFESWCRSLSGIADSKASARVAALRLQK